MKEGKNQMNKYKVTLEDAHKGYTHDQDKIFTPEETVQKFREKLEAVDLDILEETVRIDNGRLDIPIYFSLCGRDAEEVIGTKKQMGKGATPAQAEAMHQFRADCHRSESELQSHHKYFYQFPLQYLPFLIIEHPAFAQL